MSRKTEIEVGITVLVAIVILIMGVTWLKELSLARRVRVWTVTFPQSGGLAASDEVRVNGIRKGTVKSMDLAGDHVVIQLALATDVQLTSASRVAISNVGLMGEKVIAITLREGGRPLGERDTIPGEFEQGVPEVMAELGKSVGTISVITGQLQKLATTLEKEGDFRHTIKNFEETSQDLKLAVQENRVLLRHTLEDFSAAARTTKGLTTDREAELRKTLDQFSQAAENMNRLSGRLDSLRATIQQVAGKVERGDGTLGRLVNDDSLYIQVRNTTSSLQALIDDIKKNPKKYVHVSVF
ncbi:MAG TPA: MlaD family protein [Dongiaceae bacterium]|nr:MlaD family protein [Dongiaceae bacterium]